MIGYLGLGSNVGDRRANLQAAIDALPSHGVRVLASSSIYETEPVGEIRDQPDFLNACIRIDTGLGPEELLDACKAVERELGRAAGGPRHGPRAIDVDVLLLGDLEHRSERLTLPHEQVAARRFVLIPLIELDLELATPGGLRLADALAGLPLDEGVRRGGPPLRVPAARPAVVPAAPVAIRPGRPLGRWGFRAWELVVPHLPGPVMRLLGRLMLSLPRGSRARRWCVLGVAEIAWDATARTRYDLVLPIWDPACEWHWDPIMGGLGFEEVYRGHEGVRQSLAAWNDVWSEVSFTVHEILDGGDTWVMRMTGHGRGARSDVPTEMSFSSVMRLDPFIVEFHNFARDADALREAGFAPA